VDEIPKGPTGKVQRSELAQELGSRLRAEFVAPRNSVEEVLTPIWRQLLGVEQVGVHDNFFALGGDSLLATRLVARLRVTFEIEVPIATVFIGPTVAEQSLVVTELLLSQIEGMTEGEAEAMVAS
jgi:acyl carrier protein